ncbi:acyl-CoA dehydrogenase family protein [Desulfofustis limnaeus]|jgi:glutaryl-CoA dehydrogenase|uniref:Glutaryl-CoA dehydrogenase n=1 Tax=Desulfofustis limnaeus TaxID=2740163 RepID=A0ABN6M5Z9_9BACT|nr:acyl-CoA dehydrogenase family protein [Desulfofustis limnaeus]MDX9894542.1 acyl-CoA dehydrogenase family protein [Desulfofustis sp.]BDD88324.1 glutaryl-CoA dehydrogenase [Desulfofustis limnaeus]
MQNTTELTDFMGFQELLEEEERLVRQTARAFVNEQVLPIIDQHAQDETFPRHLVPLMGHYGFFGPTLPEQYGCAALSSVAYGLLMYELERGDSALRSMASVQGSLVMYPIFAYGSEEQRRRWLPQMAAGDAIGCFGLTEPDFGSNPAGMRTRAVREGKTWRINGSKMWITNGSIADVALVWATTDEGVRGFLVERGTPGFSAPQMKGKWSLRASVTSELVLDNVVVDAERSLLPGVVGLKGPLSCLTQARYGIAWGVLGAADNCYQTALAYGLQRVQFDRPIVGFQLQQQKLVEMVTELTKAQLLVLHLGRNKDRGKATPQQVSMAKMNNVRIALEVCRTARTMLGANGIMGEYPIMRHAANLESVYTYEGTHDIHTLIIGEQLTGLAAYR